MNTDKRRGLEFSTPIQFLKGVGPVLGGLLERRGLPTVGDLLCHFPRAYEDRKAARQISSLSEGDVVSIRCKIRTVTAIPMGRSQRKIYDVAVVDASGLIHCKFFRVPYRGYFERFLPDQEIRVVGKVIRYRGKLEFHHPDLRPIAPEDELLKDEVIPIYPEIDNITSGRLERLISSALLALTKEKAFLESLPISVLKKYSLLDREQALKLIHRPPSDSAREYNFRKSEAHRRLIFEEFFWLELSLAFKRAGFKKEKAKAVQSKGRLMEALKKSLPFQLTGAQERAYIEIHEDLAKTEPMSRLVQGDVGSGKTLVAFMAACDVKEAGDQSCLMAPTEILAEQHYLNATKLLQPLGLRVRLLTGKTKTAERKEILENLAAGSVDLLIGTHALIEDPVQFKELNLVIVDEQHRFGVEQRGRLKRKGQSPHFLVMTATPIPRTLAMTVYGDLDSTVINEMPPGRSPIQTRAVFDSKKKEVLDFLLQQIAKGRQAYVVYPLVEESEKIDLKNAMNEYQILVEQFPKIKFGLLHGRMKSDEKEEIMNRFRSGEVQVLVSTTVIEVGVDVPNANIMVIEHAERFGLSQLHQLRGRVGRGSHKSFCVLVMGHAVSEEARERTRFMETTTDGFKVAEFDLELRGPGEFIGKRQSGLPGFRMANLVTDIEILKEAREAAFQLLQEDSRLSHPGNRNLRGELLKILGPEGTLLIG